MSAGLHPQRLQGGARTPCVPAGATAPRWIDEGETACARMCQVEQWWTVFQDPVLNRLICNAYAQNLSLREAGFRVLEAQGRSWHQPAATSSRNRKRPPAATSAGPPARWPTVRRGRPDQFFNDWALGFNLSWELDFWGRFRRAVTADEHNLQASCANYNQVLVTLLGDVASNYVQVRTLQQRIAYVRANVELQRGILNVCGAAFEGGRPGTPWTVTRPAATWPKPKRRFPN